ncbi:MAG: hypothetical protein P8P32_11975 [Akkermansiaceae bacterium]|nr:hypothetical protein [Akkermansiaceae bacterium]
MHTQTLDVIRPDEATAGERQKPLLDLKPLLGGCEEGGSEQVPQYQASKIDKEEKPNQ